MQPDQIKTSSLLNGWRIAGWGALLALLVLPAVAMTFTDEVDWTFGDFVFAGILLFALGAGVEIAIRVGRSGPLRLGLIIATLAGFFTLWSNAAVGIIGSEDEMVNLGFTALVILAFLSTLLVWFRAHILRWIYAVVAIGQIALGIAALSLMPGHAVEWGILAAFAAIWGAAALCCHRAAVAGGKQRFE